MRVISGKYKGKKIAGFDIDGTRPTMDRVKESLFGMLQNNLKDKTCLDLFAGSGSLGIEALSNGAKKCYFIDNGKVVSKILEKNLQDIDGAVFIKSDYNTFLDSAKEKFDLIFLDPPYKLNLITSVISKILKNDLLNPDGFIICEYEMEEIKCDLEIIKEKKYGSKNIKIYKK